MPADILFDIGNVLLAFDFEKSLRTILPGKTTAIKSALAPLLEKKDSFEAGKISADDYTKWALSSLGSAATPAQFHAAWRNIFTPNLPMWATAARLHKAGHRLVLFSNINSLHAPWIYEEFPQFDLFNHAVLSFEVGAIKPQPEIYHHAINTYDLVPENPLYIDDLAVNILAGTKHGFRAHQYQIGQHAAFEEWLTAELKKLTLNSSFL